MTNLLPQRYVNRTFKIPFHDGVSDEFKLKLKFSQGEDFNNKIDRATRIYMDHFFPEFYPYRIDSTALPPEYVVPDPDAIDAIMQDVRDSLDITARFATSPPTNKQVNVFSTSYDFFGTRTQLELDGKMPPYEEALQFFREQQNLSEPTSQTTLVIASLGTTNNAFNDGMSAYQRQLQGFEGQLNISLDFNFLQTDVQKILNTLVADLVYTLRRTGTSPAFTEADTLTIQFGSMDERKPAVVGIEHLLVERSISSEPAKIGVFTNILYNRVFKDPLSIAALKNYQSVVQSVQEGALGTSVIQQMFATSGSMGGSFLDFLESPQTLETLQNPPSILDSDEFSTTFSLGQAPISGSANDFQNAFVQVAYEEGLLSPANLKALENGFQEFFTSEEMQKIKAQIAQNPKLYRRVFDKTKSKVITKARSAVSVVNDILLTGPMGFLDKKNPVIGRLFRSLGLDQLMKEVILCATFGLNYEASRIGTAIGNSLQQAQSQTGGTSGLSGLNTFNSIYNEPELPPPGGAVELPAIDWNLFKPKLKDGDVSKIIKTVLVDAVQELALTVIQTLSEILKEKCDFNNPSTHDYGNIDLSTLLPSPDATITGATSQLDQLAATYNLSTEELREYLRALSEIVSSVGVCTLFTARDTASPELIEAILEFNENYTNEYVRNNLTTPTEIMGLFAQLSEFVDVSDICEEIANTVFTLNQNNVCLVFDDADLFEDLLNRIQMPEVNFDCPDQENFINDPTITVAVPETFNALVETVEIQFINAASSLKEVLLEPVIIRGTDSNVLSSADSTADLGRNVKSTDSLESIDPTILNNIISVFDKIGEGAEDLQDAFATCEVSPSEVLGFDAAAAAEATAVTVEVLANAVNSSEFKNAIEGINTKLEGISQLTETGPGSSAPAVTTYKFNQQFTRAFRGYTNPRAGTWTNAPTEYPYQSPIYFDAKRIAPDVSYRSAQAAEEAANNYTPIELKFSFPTTLPGVTYRDIRGPNEFITVTYPAFGAENNVDFGYASDSGLIIDERLVQSFAAADDPYIANFQEESPPYSTNVYVDKFVQAYFDSPLIQDQFLQGDEEEQRAYRNEVESHEFPKANAALVEQFIQYIVDNGVFDAATLQSLNLFHLNTNCQPEDIADFLDVRGIIEQMTKEYAEAACGDAPRRVPMRMKIRDIIKYGFYLLLIQIHIAEFLIKNIFVFSAFTIDTLLEDRDSYIYRFFRSQVLSSVLAFLDSANVEVPDESIFRLQLSEYFNRKVRRPNVVQNGGIRFTQTPNDIAFLPETSFSATDDSPLIGFDEIMDYLIVERLHYARTPINNAIRKALPDTSPIDLNSALLRSMPVLEHSDATNTPGPARIREAARIAFYSDPTVFLLSRQIPAGTNSIGLAVTKKVYSMWFYDGQTQKVIGPSGETVESGPVFQDQFGTTGDVVLLLNNLYVEQETSAPKNAETAVHEESLDCVDSQQQALIESLGGHVPEHRRCPDAPSPRAAPPGSFVTTLQRLNANQPPEAFEVSELNVIQSGVDEFANLFVNDQINRTGNTVIYYKTRSLDVDEYEVMEDAQNALRAVGIASEQPFVNLVAYNAEPMVLVQSQILLDRVGWMISAVVDGDVSFLTELEPQEEESAFETPATTRARQRSNSSQTTGVGSSAGSFGETED